MTHLSKNRFGIPHARSIRSASKGQSFVELSLVALLLMLLVAGIAEYGVLLNRYLNLLDAVREAARYNSNFNPFCPPPGTASCPVGQVTPDYYKLTACEVVQVLYPVVLYPERGDDIVVSFFTVEESGGLSSITKRYPLTEAEHGWSWAQNGDDTGAANSKCHDPGLGGTRNPSTYSKQSSAFVQSRMDSTAPSVSVSLVEIFYNYPQTLRLPVFEQMIPDPIPVYTYAIMPIKNITFTPTP